MDNALPDIQQLAKMVMRIDDRQQLAELISRYGMAVDDRDFDTLASLFALDGEFNQVKGRRLSLTITAHGRPAFQPAPTTRTAGISTSHPTAWPREQSTHMRNCVLKQRPFGFRCVTWTVM